MMSAGKILVVDDDQNICELLRLYIEKEGFEVRIANDGRKALEIFEEQTRFDYAGYYVAGIGRVAGVQRNQKEISMSISLCWTAKR